MQHPSAQAVTAPDRPAVVVGGSGAVLTYGQLEARSNRVAHVLRDHGVGLGDHVALVVENGTEFFEVMWGALRAGIYVTPVNWHLNPTEMAYIVDDCGASLLFGSAEQLARLGDGVDLPRERRIAVGAAVPGLAAYEDVLAAASDQPIADESEGSYMFYSSGTTGRPKGIKPPTIGGRLGEPSAFTGLMTVFFGVDESSVYLSPSPLYHAAPAGWTTGAHRLGATTVVMERFDPIETLRLIERHRVTHVQFVPTHMVRLLKLPEEERSRFDLSSLRYVIHAAAPCPPEVKRAFIEWVGPKVHEYYSGSEGAGFCIIGPEEWLEHPGSVGKSLLGPAHICDPDGRELGPREEGQVWFQPPSRFEYHGDPEKTAAAFDERGWASLGDIGWVDEEGYLYLTDRVANTIISGGVNIYPREVEDVLVMHPRVADVAVIGVAHPEMGESVRAIVEPVGPVEPGPVESGPVEDEEAFAEELITFCRDRLTHYKCPTSIALVDELPRLPTGKIAKRLFDDSLRAPYDEGTVVGRARSGTPSSPNGV
jgi:acyl-CoA synthetase (AMP-forming)/AMP-acid ligase II